MWCVWGFLWHRVGVPGGKGSGVRGEGSRGACGGRRSFELKVFVKLRARR